MRNWIVDRFGLKPIHDNTLDRRVAKAPWYYGDGATLTLLLGVLVVTGMMMTLTYSPHPDAAYESIKYITEVQILGWFIRAVHYWAAGFMTVMLFFHLFREILVGGYKSPREGTWLIGVLLFFAVLVMSFTGYVLRWDERAIHALKVPLHMVQRFPLIGDDLVLFIQGGEDPTARTLTRLYAVHVIFVPLAIFALVGFHLYLIILHGITSRRERERPIHSAAEQKELYHAQADSEKEGETFYPDTMVKSGSMAMVVFVIVIVLAVVVGPAVLYPEANLVETSEPAEEWWWWWYSGLAALLPPWLAPYFYVLFPIIVFLILASLPFVDRSPFRGMRKRPIAVASVVFCVLAILVLSELRRRSRWTGWPLETLPPVPEGVVLSETAEQGRRLFVQYGCNSCHPVAGGGRQVAVDLAQIRDRLSRQEMRAFILQPPRGVAMPAYEGRLTEQELDQLLDFVHAAQTFPRRL